MSRAWPFLVGLIVCLMNSGVSSAEIKQEYIWNADSTYVVPWDKMSIEYKTFALERYWSEINYSLANLGKSFKDIDPTKVNDEIYKRDVGYITYGLIAGHYCWYGNYKKCAEYHYKDYLQAWKCSKESARIKPECWGGAPGEWISLLSPVVNIYELHNDYKGALPYYREWLNDWASKFEGKTLEEKLKNLKAQVGEDEDWKDAMRLIERWEKAKALAKTEKPIPMDPAVQRHEWFYSRKSEEVLKALDYYHTNKVKFMIEKAVKHKNPVVTKKAMEYLDNWEARPTEKKKSEQTREDKK